MQPLPPSQFELNRPHDQSIDGGRLPFSACTIGFATVAIAGAAATILPAILDGSVAVQRVQRPLQERGSDADTHVDAGIEQLGRNRGRDRCD
jgi:hypothetical protein